MALVVDIAPSAIDGPARRASHAVFFSRIKLFGVEHTSHLAIHRPRPATLGAAFKELTSPRGGSAFVIHWPTFNLIAFLLSFHDADRYEEAIFNPRASLGDWYTAMFSAHRRTRSYLDASISEDDTERIHVLARAWEQELDGEDSAGNPWWPLDRSKDRIIAAAQENTEKMDLRQRRVQLTENLLQPAYVLVKLLIEAGLEPEHLWEYLRSAAYQDQYEPADRGPGADAAAYLKVVRLLLAEVQPIQFRLAPIFGEFEDESGTLQIEL